MKGTASLSRPLGVSLVLVGLAGALGATLWTRQSSRVERAGGEVRPLEGLKVFGTVPDFSLIERAGRRITRRDLQGKVWIASFIYTHCTETCPLQSAQMARLQADFATAADLRLVSFTVDPEQDTPEVLVEYAARFGADRDRWLFLTGEKQAIYRLAQEGFRLSVVDPAEAQPPPPGRGWPTQGSAASERQRTRASVWVFSPMPALAHSGHPGKPFLHSSRFVLVDRQARIRGYYHSNEEEALQRLRRDAHALLRGDRS